ncbi:hypothetical protein D3C75_1280390 [compost metagenome]
MLIKAAHRTGRVHADDKRPPRLFVEILMHRRALADLLPPGISMQTVGQQLFFDQPTVKFIFEFRNTEGGQLWRQ